MKIDISLYKINHMKKYFFILFLAVGCSKDEERDNRELVIKGQKIELAKFDMRSISKYISSDQYDVMISLYDTLGQSSGQYLASYQIRHLNEQKQLIPITSKDSNATFTISASGLGFLDTGLRGYVYIYEDGNKYNISMNIKNKSGSKVIL